MEINASKIFNTAINLNSGTIKKYLIEEQKKSSFSPQVFFDLLLSHTKKISISKEIEYLNGKVLELTYDLKIFDEEVAPTLSDLNREYNRTKKTKKLEEAKAKAINHELFYEIVNRLFEQSISGTGAKPNPDDRKEEVIEEEVSLVSKFNGMAMEQVRAFFMPLVTKKNKDGKQWMTEEDFEIFMKRTFLEIDLPKPKINVGHGNKYAVVSLFYKFYDFCDSENFTENNKKEPYLSLLKNAFNTTTFNDVELSNFKVKSKYSWN